MSDAQLLVSHREGVTTLTMNRPGSRNALTPEMGALLETALREAAADPSVRAVVLTGAGGAFCAGGDVKSMATRYGSERSFEQRAQSLRDRAEASRLLYEMPKPTIAVLPGPAAGAGLALAMACDFRIAVDSAKLTVAFTKVGLAGDYGASWLIERIVGPAKARELFMLCPVLMAADALRLGLLTQVHPTDRFAAEAEAFVAGLATGPTVSFGYAKQNLNLAAVSDLRTSIEVEANHQARCMYTADHAEATKAFAQKRPPRFVGS